ncbi:hypothetical protein QYM36_004230 [Artemia franciscana]|uniref:Uncharacterized protein n=1 Tax=Artemia franciscana TaxID=6661 RepID=A0AA88HY39_ARTSF|nr:hypothetical protein QYM36_004230 [Artemia franciscana]
MTRVEEKKTQNYREKALDLVKSYVFDGTQVTLVYNSVSSFLPLSSSVDVPRGSTMGSLFFLFYIKKLYCTTASSFPNEPFADEKAASVCDKSLNELQIDITHEYNRILK